jgi:hypothetical protein
MCFTPILELRVMARSTMFNTNKEALQFMLDNM